MMLNSISYEKLEKPESVACYLAKALIEKAHHVQVIQKKARTSKSLQKKSASSVLSTVPPRYNGAMGNYQF